MSRVLSVEEAYKVLRAAGSDNLVVKVQPGNDCAKSYAHHPKAIFHDGTIARSQAATPSDPQEDCDAEFRAALLVVAAVDGTEAPRVDFNDKDIAYLRLVCEGLNDAQCAERLGLSLRAIKSRKKSVLAAASCSSLSHAVKRFVRET